VSDPVLHDHEGLVARLLPGCRIPVLRAEGLEPNWWSGHTTSDDREPRLTSVQIGSGDPEVTGGPRVRVSTGEPEEDDGDFVTTGGCEMAVDGETVAMQVLREREDSGGRSAESDGAPAAEWPQHARGHWRGYEVHVQATGVPLDGLRLTRAGDLTQYRRYVGPER
jgi:hypothetical protein